jgi:hypothetical protein
MARLGASRAVNVLGEPFLDQAKGYRLTMLTLELLALRAALAGRAVLPYVVLARISG